MNKQVPTPSRSGETSVLNRLAARPARIPSKVVLGGDQAVVIVHGADEYLLRVNKDGKLVLSR